MRSRFSAFAVGDAAYLLKSWHPLTRPPALELDPEQHWLRLEILETSGGGLLQVDGVVEFRAHHHRRGQSGVLRERSRFRREGGLWTYLDGVPL